MHLTTLQPHADLAVERSPTSHWQLTGVSPDPRDAAPPLRGSLGLACVPVTPDLELQATLTPVGGRRPVDVTVQARLIGIDRAGDWLLSGTAVVAGAPAEVAVRVHDGGVYRRGDRHTRWFRLDLEVRAKRRRSGRVSQTWRHDRFELDVNGEEATGASRATLRG